MVSNKAGRNYGFQVIAVLSGSLCLLASKVDLNILNVSFFGDLGWQLYVSELTSMGKLPYRDFWAHWAPGIFYLNALAFKIFGASIYSAKLVLAIATVISILIVYRISERLMPKPFAMAISLIAIPWGNMTLNVPYSAWFSTCFGLLAVLYFIKYLESSNRKSLWLTLTGVALGVTFSFKQPIGVLNLAAIASATILSVYMMERPPDEKTSRDSRDPAWLGYFVILSTLAVLLVCLLAPVCSLLLAMHEAGVRFDANKCAVFIVPICLVIVLMLFLFLRAVIVLRRQTSLWSLFLILIKRGLALTAGFVLPVIPWFAAFSVLLGWKEFSEIILLLDPALDNYRQVYALIGQQLQIIPIQVFLSHLFVILICSVIVGLLIRGVSGKSAPVALAALSCIVIIVYRWFYLHRDQHVSYGLQLYYLPLVLTIFLLSALLFRSKGNPFSLARSRQDFMILSILVFSVYSFISLIAFNDDTHYQMIIFPWLVCVGYAQYLVYDKAARMPANRACDTILRKGGILFATSLVFLVPCIEVPMSNLVGQYRHNLKYYDVQSQGPDAKVSWVLTEMTSDKGKIFLNRALEKDVSEVVQYLRDNTTEDDFVFGGPSTTMFNFLAGRRFPSTQMYFLFNLAPDQEQEKIVNELIENRPKYCVCDAFTYYDSPPPDDLDLLTFWKARGYPTIGNYLSTHYRLDRRIGRFYLFRHR